MSPSVGHALGVVGRNEKHIKRSLRHCWLMRQQFTIPKTKTPTEATAPAGLRQQYARVAVQPLANYTPVNSPLNNSRSS
jgi:hypothetical protein